MSLSTLRPRFGPGRTLGALLLVTLPVLVQPTSARAQAPARPPVHPDLARADSLLVACVEAAGNGRAEEAGRLSDEAEALYRRLEEVDGLLPIALTGRARTRTGCRIPLAEPMTQGRLLQAADQLLLRAVEADPDFWPARFNLAMNDFHAPEFFGRTDDGIATFEVLLRDHGKDLPEHVLAEVHLRLGDLYLRKGLPDEARRIWEEGLERLPGEERLRQRLHGLRGPDATAREKTVPGGDVPVYQLEPLIVEAGSYSMGEVRSGTPLTRREVYTTPGGTADVLQVFQTMPGVTRANEGSDLYVRGGDPAESAVFVDGARLFHAGTFETLNGSIFGVLDPEVLSTAYFSSGGFSARYGDALSGVLDVETEGRPRERSWRVGLNLVSAALTARTPLGDRAGAWSSTSATHTGPLLALQGRSDEYPDAPGAFQGTLSVATEPRSSLRLRATALAEDDETHKIVEALGYTGTFRGDTHTRLVTVSADHRPSDALALRVVAGITTRSTGFRLGVLDRRREDRSGQVRLDAERPVGDVGWIRAGLEAARMSARLEGNVPLTDALAPGSPVLALPDSGTSTRHLGGYTEVGLRPRRDLALVLGLRADRLPGETAATLDPRASVAYRTGDWTLRLGTGLFHQGRRRVRYESPHGGEPAGVPRRAAHLALGVQREGPLSVRAEAFLKEYGRYVDDGRSGPRVVDGHARGVDVLAKWEGEGAVAGWLSWSLLDAEVELTDGRRVPSAVDVTHSITAVATWTLGDVWELGATARYATGRPFTPVLGRTGPDDPAPSYGVIHGDRLPDYFRLDGRITRLVPWRHGLLVAYLEGLNLLGRPNVMSYTWDEAYENRRPVESFFSRTALILGVEVQFL